MAAVIRRDEIDWSAYERATEASVKVRNAAEFSEELDVEFADRHRARKSVMFSTKLGECIEFRPGETTCWAGFNGHRKSLMTSQVALDLCFQGERTLIASMEMSPGKTLARMARQMFGMARPDTDMRRRFMGWSDGRLWLFDHLGRVSPTQMLSVCRYFADELKGMHVFIDSMMMVCASEEHLDEQKQFVTDCVRAAQESGLHIHIVAHCRKPANGTEDKPPTKYDLRGSGAISDQSSNVITVWSNKPKKAKLDNDPNDAGALDQPDALVTVEKQRNGEYEGRLKLWWDERSLRFMNDRTSPVEPYRIDIE